MAATTPGRSSAPLATVPPIRTRCADPDYLYGGGGTGGDAFIDNCPHGYAMRSLYLKWGSWIDGVAGVCSYFSP